ncbi:hypothetical protein HMN09_00878000 [Mycena chlorophos]|uniref:Uncharacterized protein n=1 Tax=Mycena chlorophos TaxID=658473 RepID=A0A8H6SR61_MYCCL|nr:hypothetical protein HMN09_00878000 [Mycena chlorophos]
MQAMSTLASLSGAGFAFRLLTLIWIFTAQAACTPIDAPGTSTQEMPLDTRILSRRAFGTGNTAMDALIGIVLALLLLSMIAALVLCTAGQATRSPRRSKSAGADLESGMKPLHMKAKSDSDSGSVFKAKRFSEISLEAPKKAMTR